MENTARNIPLDEVYEFDEIYYQFEEPLDEEPVNEEPVDEKPRRKGNFIKRRKSMRQENRKSIFAKKAKEKKHDEDRTTPEYKQHRWIRGHHHILFEE